MKQKTKKILKSILGITLILFLFLFVNSWAGNPISKVLAKNAAEKYIKKNYSDLNLEIQSSNYNFKYGSYKVLCQSQSSLDTKFPIFVDSFGNVLHDWYEYEVANNFTTYRRLNHDLHNIGDKLLRENLKYNISNALFSFKDLTDEQMLTLKKDMTIDIHNPPFGISASVTIIDPDVSYEKMAEVLKETAKICSNENIPIAEYSVHIQYDNLVSVQNGKEVRENLIIGNYNIPIDILNAKDLPKALAELDEE